MNAIMIRWILVLLLALPFTIISAQSTTELENAFANANDKQEKMNLAYQLAERYLSAGDTKKAIDYSKQTTDLANSLRDDAMAADGFYVAGKAYLRKRDLRTADNKFQSSIGYGKKVNAIELVVQGYLERIAIARKQKNTSRLSSLSEEAIQFFTKDSNYRKIKTQQAGFQSQLAKLDKERKDLQREKDKLNGEIASLQQDKSQLSEANTDLTQTNTQLQRQRQRIAEEKQQIAEEKEIVEEQLEEEAEKVGRMTEKVAKAELIEEKNRRRIEALEHQQEMDALSIKNAELQEAQSQQFMFGAGILSALLLLLTALFYSRYRAKKRTSEALEKNNKAIIEERERSNELLLNILPENIAQELKETGKAKARSYNQITVMFTDFKNFTRMAERLTPEQLVKELDDCFKAFDLIVSQYPDIEKIKTIGDAYMCASGFSGSRTASDSIVRAALEFQEYLNDVKLKKQGLGLPFFEARIGLHTGPVVAGVVGSKKFSYDIWGDTVNIAARMEQNSEVGAINISQNTYNLIRDKFRCTHRGRIQAKNKGMIDMYFVNRTV